MRILPLHLGRSTMRLDLLARRPSLTRPQHLLVIIPISIRVRVPVNLGAIRELNRRLTPTLLTRRGGGGLARRAVAIGDVRLLRRGLGGASSASGVATGDVGGEGAVLCFEFDLRHAEEFARGVDRGEAGELVEFLEVDLRVRITWCGDVVWGVGECRGVRIVMRGRRGTDLRVGVFKALPVAWKG